MTEDGIKGYLRDRHLGSDEKIDKLKFGVGNTCVPSISCAGLSVRMDLSLTGITGSNSAFVRMSSSSRIHLSSGRSSRLAPRD